METLVQLALAAACMFFATLVGAAARKLYDERWSSSAGPKSYDEEPETIDLLDRAARIADGDRVFVSKARGLPDDEGRVLVSAATSINPVRAEQKRWEGAFRRHHGRGPTKAERRIARTAGYDLRALGLER